MSGSQPIIYIKANQSSQVQGQDVFLKDLASVLCADAAIQAKVKALKVYHFRGKYENSHRAAGHNAAGHNVEGYNADIGNDMAVISILEVIQKIQELVPGIEVVSLGQSDMVVHSRALEKRHPKLPLIKVAFISLICFFGAAYTIMAYHNDVGTCQVFARIYELVMGQESSGFTMLEISYSIGLTAGITIFFNHLGRKKLSEDPTPVSVEMRVYEENVAKAIVESESREKKEVENDTP